MAISKKLFPLFLALVIIVGSVQATSYAEETKNTSVKVLEPISLGSVALKENVSAQVNNLIVLPSSDNQMVGLTLKIKNNSNAELNFTDYWVYLYTKSGTKLNVKMTDNTVSKIPAKTTLDISFTGTIGNNIKITDLIVKVIKWDFSVASYTRVLGELAVSQRYNPVTPANNGKIVVTGDVKASFIINQASIGKSESYYRPAIKLIIRNDGNRSITLPDYQLYILTKSNLMYPLTVKDVKGATLDPLTEKEFQLTTSIPLEVAADGWKMAVVNNLNDGKDKQPVAVFELPQAQVDTGDELGKFYTFTNTDGIYNIRLDSMNRLPIEDNDLVIANMTIMNKGNTSLPVPLISGKYVFNESIEKIATSTNNDKLIALQPGTSMNLQLVSKVPYTFEISKLSLTIQQKESSDSSGNEVLDLVEFTQKGQFEAVKKVNSKTGFKIDDIGYRSEVKLRNQVLYSGETADILTAQLTVVNGEKRQAAIKKLAGYYEKEDGTIYPATFSSVTDKLNPAGTALVFVTATIPKGTDVKDISLVVGKAVTETTTSTGESTESLIGYTSPFSFILPELAVSQQGLQKIDISPYLFSISRIATQIRYKENQVILDFDYTMSQDLLTKANLKGHKVVIELKDKNQNNVFDKELTLPLSGSETETDNSSLLIGEHTLRITWTNEELIMLLNTLKNYEFNVYYQIESGYRTLIATQELPWLVNRTLTN
jgi:hypothetical protein